MTSHVVYTMKRVHGYMKQARPRLRPTGMKIMTKALQRREIPLQVKCIQIRIKKRITIMMLWVRARWKMIKKNHARTRSRSILGCRQKTVKKTMNNRKMTRLLHGNKTRPSANISTVYFPDSLRSSRPPIRMDLSSNSMLGGSLGTVKSCTCSRVNHHHYTFLTPGHLA